MLQAENRVLKGHKFQINMVRFSPDGEHIAASACDGTSKIREVKTGRCIKTFTGLQTRWCSSPAIDISPGDDEYYFIPSDFAIRGDMGSMYRNGGVSAGALGTLYGDIKARKILVMLDTCHSGRAVMAF